LLVAISASEWMSLPANDANRRELRTLAQ
jgi:hypothetical protein